MLIELFLVYHILLNNRKVKRIGAIKLFCKYLKNILQMPDVKRYPSEIAISDKTTRSTVLSWFYVCSSVLFGAYNKVCF